MLKVFQKIFARQFADFRTEALNADLTKEVCLHSVPDAVNENMIDVTKHTNWDQEELTYTQMETLILS